MTAALQQQLSRGVETLGIELPEHVVAQLINYINLLQQWNKSYNLTAVRNIDDMVSKHLLDSLAVLPYLGEGTVIDIGTGAGLPGIPLALARPDQDFTLLDSNGKKTRFLTQAKIKLGLGRVKVVHSRVEQHAGSYDIVISRAYAALDDFIASTRHLHHEHTRVLAMQGKLDQAISIEGYVSSSVQQLQVPGLNADRHLLEIVSSDVTTS